MSVRSSACSASTRTCKSKPSSPRLKAQTVNEKGEINTWSSSSADGKLLATLFENKLIDDATAKELKQEYT
eukprot:15353266-Ditylum_brightwellii.AAC.2